MEEIVRLHGVPVSIVSNRDLQFTLRFSERMQDAKGTKLRTCLGCACWISWVAGYVNCLRLGLLIITAFKQLLAWHHTKLCMGISVDPHCIWMKLVKDIF